MTFVSNIDVTQYHDDSMQIHQHMFIEKLVHVDEQSKRRMQVKAEASREWREDPGRCFRELLSSKCQAEREAICIELFMRCVSGTQVGYISQLRTQFIDWRAGE